MSRESSSPPSAWVIAPGATDSPESYLLSCLLFGYVGVGYAPWRGELKDRQSVEAWREGREKVDWNAVKKWFNGGDVAGGTGKSVGRSMRSQHLALYFVRKGDTVWLKQGTKVVWRGEAVTDYPLTLEEEKHLKGREPGDDERRFVHGSSHPWVIRVRWDQADRIRDYLKEFLSKVTDDPDAPLDRYLDRYLKPEKLSDEEWRQPLDNIELRGLLGEGNRKGRLGKANDELVEILKKEGEPKYKWPEISSGQWSVGWVNSENKAVHGETNWGKWRRGASMEQSETKDRESQAGSSNESPLVRRLKRVRNLVLEGVPGTGKTFVVKEICKSWSGQPLTGNGSGRYAITLHPATTYEDFVEGIRPGSGHSTTVDWSQPEGKAKRVHPDSDFKHYFHVQQTPPGGNDSNTPAFSMQDGFFLRVCAEAVNHPESDFVVLLDEFNRCNVPKVMGDLLTTLERSKRATWVEEKQHWDLGKAQVVALPGSKRHFFVPENVYVIACMNTTDRSVAPLDAALRRRFAFHRLWPKGFEPGSTSGHAKDAIARSVWGDEKAPDAFTQAVELWITVNKVLKEYGPDAMIGHSYLYDLKEDIEKHPEDATQLVEHHWNDHILPQLAEVLTANNISWWREFKSKLGESEKFEQIEDLTHKDAVGFLRVPVLRYKPSSATSSSADSGPKQV